MIGTEKGWGSEFQKRVSGYFRNLFKFYQNLKQKRYLVRWGIYCESPGKGGNVEQVKKRERSRQQAKGRGRSTQQIKLRGQSKHRSS